MSNVTQLSPRIAVPRPTVRTASYATKLRDAEAVMDRLRIEMHEYDVDVLANMVGVSKSCIMAIRSGRTKWPRPKTFFGILDALNMHMTLEYDE